MAYLNMATNPIILEFIAGYFIAYYLKEVVFLINNISNSVFIFIISVFLIMIYFESKILYFFNDFHMGLMFLPSLFIFVYGIKIFDVDQRNVPRFLAFTSRISYSIYLLHMAVIFIAIEVSTMIFGSEVFGVFSARFNLFFISLFFSWVISYFFCLFFEEKLSREIKKYIFR